MVRTLILVLFAVIVGIAPAAAEIAFSLSETEITLETPAETGAVVRRTFVLTGTGLSADPEGAAPTVTFLENERPGAPSVQQAIKLVPIGSHKDADMRQWALPLDFTLGRNSAGHYQQVLSVELAREDATSVAKVSRGIVLKLVVNSAFTWEVIDADLGKLTLTESGDHIPLTVRVGPVNATNVRALPNFPQTDTTTARGVQQLELCRIDAGGRLQECGAALSSLDASSTYRLGLAAAGSLWPTLIGTYNGKVTLISDEDLAGQSVNRSFDATNSLMKFLGSGAILLGVVVAFFLTQIVRGRINRARALLPVADLLRRLDGLENRLDVAVKTIGAGTNKPLSEEATRSTKELFVRIRAHLQPSKLEKHGLPARRFPLPVPSETGTDAEGAKHAQNLQAAIQNGAAWTETALVLIADGFEAIARGANPDQAVKAEDAVKALEVLVGTNLPTVDRLPTAPEIGGWREEVEGVVTEAMAASEEEATFLRTKAATSRAPLTRERLTIELFQMSLLTWGVYLLLTAGLGTYVLVLGNTTFGSGRDFFECLLWGFGLPIAGQSITNTTRDNVASVLGITLPRFDTS